MDTELLCVTNVVTRYPVRRGLIRTILGRAQKHVHAVDGVTLSVRRGEFLALVGESGCGKTTTVQTALRLVQPESGEVMFDGLRVDTASPSDLRRLRRRAQIIYQDPYESLDPRFTVAQTVGEPLRIHVPGLNRAERYERVVESLESVDLSPARQFLGRYPHQLSGGQRQRVAIAASLVLEPELLVADEPVSMLDVSARAAVLTLLDRLRRDREMAIVLITHDLSIAAQYADRVAVMYLGRIVEEGPARQVLSDPRHPYTRALISVVPNPDPSMRAIPQVLQGEIPSGMNIPSGCRFHPRCPVAIDQCQVIDPQLGPVADTQDSNHRVACILETDSPAQFTAAGTKGGVVDAGE